MKGFRLQVVVFSLFLLLFAVICTLTPIFAQSTDELAKQLTEKQAEIAKLEGQLSETRGKQKTLKSQLSIIDSQTKITTLRIEETHLKIEKLEREINDLTNRIERISNSVDTLSEILLNRILQTYKYGSISTVDLLFSSHGFAQLLERFKYLQVAQANDKKVLYQLQATKSAYNDQKQDRQVRQVEAEKLTKELEAYSDQLEEQKRAKEELLNVTRNDEARYQAIISQLRAELASITQAISNVGVAIGPVTKGQSIPGALLGSTGCSTGPHLHFEVFINAKVEGGKILGTRVDPQSYLDNGTLGQPLDNYTVTAKYGAEGSSYIPDWPPHTGIDMAAGQGTAIKASESGIAYPTSATCSCYVAKSCTPQMMSGGSATGKGVVVDHQNGIVTLYWHIL